MTKPNMIQKHFYIPPKLAKELAKKARRLEITEAEAIRRALDLWARQIDLEEAR